MIRINLLPKEQRVQRAPVSTTRILATVAGVILLLAMAYGWYWLSSDVSRLETSIQETRTELKRFEELAKQVDKYRAEKKRLEEKIQVIQTLVAAQAGPVRLLDELSKALPAEVWLTALNRTGKRLEISGIAFTNFNVAALMTNLGKATDVISNVDLVVSEKTTVEQIPVERFTISMDIKG